MKVLVYIVFRLFFVGENVCKSRVLSTTHDSIIQPKTSQLQTIPSTRYNLFSLVMSLLSFFWRLKVNFAFSSILCKRGFSVHVVTIDRVSYRGGVPWNSPPPPEILKLSMVIIVLSLVLNNNLVPDCIRSNLRGSKLKILLGEHAPRLP